MKMLRLKSIITEHLQPLLFSASSKSPSLTRKAGQLDSFMVSKKKKKKKEKEREGGKKRDQKELTIFPLYCIVNKNDTNEY